MIWPRPLAQIAINKALHNENGREGDIANGWRISRLRFFLYCFGGMFLYYVSSCPAIINCDVGIGLEVLT